MESALFDLLEILGQNIKTGALYLVPPWRRNAGTHKKYFPEEFSRKKAGQPKNSR